MSDCTLQDHRGQTDIRSGESAQSVPHEMTLEIQASALYMGYCRVQTASRSGYGSFDPRQRKDNRILRGDPCAYCGSRENITADHITPRAHGGPNAFNNLTAACYSCNNARRDTPLLHWLLKRGPS